jgi:hypothetical protein
MTKEIEMMAMYKGELVERYKMALEAIALISSEGSMARNIALKALELEE